MKDAIESSITLLAGLITKDSTPDEAMKYAQAALSLAHTRATIKTDERMDNE